MQTWANSVFDRIYHHNKKIFNRIYGFNKSIAIIWIYFIFTVQYK